MNENNNSDDKLENHIQDYLNKLISECIEKNEKIQILDTKIKTLTERLHSCAELVSIINNTYDNYKNPQSIAWNREHGVHYVLHHMSENWTKTRVPIWEVLLSFLNKEYLSNIFEIGANIGANLLAIKHLLGDIELDGCEINDLACKVCCYRNFNIKKTDILEMKFEKQYDLIFLEVFLYT